MALDSSLFSTTLNENHRQSTLPHAKLDTPQSWLHVPRNRSASAWRLLPQSLLFQRTRLLRFGYVLRQVIRSMRGHISVLLAKTPWTVILGVGGRRDANGYFLPDARTIFRNECITRIKDAVSVGQYG
jgi:hypothetical protein